MISILTSTRNSSEMETVTVNLSTSPPIMDEASKWLDHLLDENILQREGGEPLMDVSKISKEVYAEALVRLITHNRDRDNDNIDLDVPDDVGRDNLTSTERMVGLAQPSPMQQSLISYLSKTPP